MRVGLVAGVVCCVFLAVGLGEQAAAQSQSTSSSKHPKSSSARLVPDIDAGTVTDGVYRNRALALSCRIPAGWVLRTDEMNASDEDPDSGASSSELKSESTSSAQATQKGTGDGGRVLLAAFSRPPAARAGDVNASIVIAAEKVESYPGLKEAAQYFGPLTEVAKAQGFAVDEEPYEIQIGTKTLVRGDFHKDVASRVMRQSTLAFIAHGYAISVTVIGGTEEEVEGLMDGLSFQGSAKVTGPKK